MYIVYISVHLLPWIKPYKSISNTVIYSCRFLEVRNAPPLNKNQQPRTTTKPKRNYSTVTYIFSLCQSCSKHPIIHYHLMKGQRKQCKTQKKTTTRLKVIITSISHLRFIYPQSPHVPPILKKKSTCRKAIAVMPKRPSKIPRCFSVGQTSPMDLPGCFFAFLWDGYHGINPNKSKKCSQCHAFSFEILFVFSAQVNDFAIKP